MLDVDELDWQIIDALRVNPRAPWALVGHVLGVDPVTVARRWQRLSGDGLAWVTAYPGGGGGINVAAAIVEVDCAPGAAASVAAKLAEHPYAVEVKHTAGGRDLVILALTPGIAGLSHYLTGDVETVPGVQAARGSVVTGMATEGSSWRADVLDDHQRQQLRPSPYAGPVDPTVRPVDLRILTALALNGRMGVNDLANSSDTSPSTIRRRLPGLIGSRQVLLRTDVSRPLSRHPAAATFFVAIAANALQDGSRRIAALPGVRTCISVAGPSNLIVDVWLPDTSHVRDFEILLNNQRLPLTISDRSVVLRTVKHAGRIVDDDGRATRFIPYNYQVLEPPRL